MKIVLRTIADGVMWILTMLFISVATVSVVGVLTMGWWMPWIETEVLGVCKAYHANQMIRDKQENAYTPFADQHLWAIEPDGTSWTITDKGLLSEQK